MIIILKSITSFTVVFMLFLLFISFNDELSPKTLRKFIKYAAYSLITIIVSSFLLIIYGKFFGYQEVTEYLLLNVLPAILILYGLIFKFSLSLECSKYPDFYFNYNNYEINTSKVLKLKSDISNIISDNDKLKQCKINIMNRIKYLDTTDSDKYHKQRNDIENLLDDVLYKNKDKYISSRSDNELNNIHSINELNRSVSNFSNEKADISDTVFLSYAHENVDEARKIYEDLIKAGISVWFDQESLLPGQDWDSEITSVIKKSKFFLILLSKKSLSKRGYVQKEIKIAIEAMMSVPASETFIVPVRIEECEPRDELLTGLHWTNLYPNYESGLQKVISVIV